MSVVVKPSARETFTPRELTTAYRDFIEGGPQYVSAEPGLKASAFWFGTRVLIVYEEAETGVVSLIHPTLQAETLSTIENTRNPGSIDLIAHAEYLLDGRSR